MGADLYARGPAIAPGAYLALAFEHLGPVGLASHRCSYQHSVAHRCQCLYNRRVNAAL